MMNCLSPVKSGWLGESVLNENDQEQWKQGGLLRRIFFGAEELRPGWSCLVFLALLLGITRLVTLVMRLAAHGAHGAAARVPAGPMTPPLLIAGELASVLVILGVTAALARWQHRPLASYGLGGVAAGQRFGFGLAAGFAAISALVGLLWASHLAVLHLAGLQGLAAAGYGLSWGAAFTLVAASEELLLRGYLLWTLARSIGFGWAALLLSVGFGLIHGNNPGETPVGLFSAGAVGLLFCLSIWYMRSLWWAVGFHAAWDWGESFFWGTSDSGLVVQGHLFNEQPAGSPLLSGGVTGPEGSLLVFPVLLVCALLMFGWWRGRTRAVLPA